MGEKENDEGSLEEEVAEGVKNADRISEERERESDEDEGGERGEPTPVEEKGIEGG
jgi:hypothetical protein